MRSAACCAQPTPTAGRRQARILYMTTLPLADARTRLSESVAEAQATRERYEITGNDRPAAVLVADDDYEAMPETIAVLADAEPMRAIQEG